MIYLIKLSNWTIRSLLYSRQENFRFLISFKLIFKMQLCEINLETKDYVIKPVLVTQI